MQFGFQKREHHEPGEEVEIFESYLRRKGLKVTTARRELLDLIFRDHSHFTPEQLYDRCRENGLSVSKATLYRTLSVLMDCKLLAAHDFGEGVKYYEHVFGHRHHDHLFCVVCKKILEFRSPEIERMQDEAAAEFDFVPTDHSLSIFGVCKDCQATPEGRSEIAAAESKL